MMDEFRKLLGVGPEATVMISVAPPIEKNNTPLEVLFQLAEKATMFMSSPTQARETSEVQTVLRIATVKQIIERMNIEAWPWWIMPSVLLGFSIIPEEHYGKVSMIVEDWQQWLAEQNIIINDLKRNES